eukprot:CAMPEP_0173171150 /NCGR_PEP_ID=MMETSP1141-20130122/1608_1 /TAXON_ID=483371 /ORGANISM="non described non described, Strain CCMP2298" /LENGTH=104 /DNA_ID=CAMNT_0014093073 /DNA_START=39 /DNA_END=353 /DNA_ORIENTATION=-
MVSMLSTFPECGLGLGLGILAGPVERGLAAGVTSNPNPNGSAAPIALDAPVLGAVSRVFEKGSFGGVGSILVRVPVVPEAMSRSSKAELMSSKLAPFSAGGKAD